MIACPVQREAISSEARFRVRNFLFARKFRITTWIVYAEALTPRRPFREK
jgi:hypothetical protein